MKSFTTFYKKLKREYRAKHLHLSFYGIFEKDLEDAFYDAARKSKVVSSLSFCSASDLATVVFIYGDLTEMQLGYLEEILNIKSKKIILLGNEIIELIERLPSCWSDKILMKIPGSFFSSEELVRQIEQVSIQLSRPGNSE